MKKIKVDGKEINLKSYSIDGLKKLLNEINKSEQEVKKELENILNKLNDE